MARNDLQNALKLSRSVENACTARADPNYESANGMFGGWTTAVALRAVCDDADGDATPAAITINFVDKIDPGTEVCIRTRRVGAGRSVSYWQAEVTSTDSDDTLATVSSYSRRGEILTDTFPNGIASPSPSRTRFVRPSSSPRAVVSV